MYHPTHASAHSEMAKVAVVLLIFTVVGIRTASGQTNPCTSAPCQNLATCQQSVLDPGYVCFCGDDWIGQNCETPKAQLIIGARRGCDQTFYQPLGGTITSPRWPDTYVVNQICYYQIKFPNMTSIRLNYEFFDTELDKDELYFNEGPTPPSIRGPDVFKLSGPLQLPGDLTRPPLVFDTNQLTLVWESDRNLGGAGFEFSFLVDSCFNNQCQGSSTCLNEQDGYICFCPSTHTGEFCEFGLVLIAVTQPTITTSSTLVEGTLFYAFNFDLTLTPSARAEYEAVGANLWRVHVFLSRSSDGSGQELAGFDPFLTPQQAGVFWLPPAETVLRGVQAFFTFSELTCSAGLYFCATIDRTSTADFVLEGDPTNASLTGCTPVVCRGVELSSTAIQSLSDVNIQGMQVESFTFDLSLTSVAGAGSVQGSNLWRVTAFASPLSDGSVRVGETEVTLSALAGSSGVSAGSQTVISGLQAVLPLQGVDCSQLRYFCVEIQRNPLSSPSYTLSGVPSDDVLITCERLMCGAVEVFRLSFAHSPAMILANSASNQFTFDLTAITIPGSATISGTNLWLVDVFTSTNINGLGTPAVNQTVVLPPSLANTPILQGGDSLVLSDFVANLDLRGLSCSDVPYICINLRRNVLSDPVFQLEGVPDDSVLTSCQFVPCSVFQQCSDLTCANGGTCLEGAVGSAPTCVCLPGWTGPTCEEPVNACDGVTCLFGGTCVDNQFDFICICTLGRQGRLCGEISTGVIIRSVTPITQNALLREGISINALNLGVAIQTDASGDSIQGTGLWDVDYFLSGAIDGSGRRIDLQTSSLTSGQAGTSINAGASAAITGIFTLADLESLTCFEVPYVCAELSKGATPNPNFLLTGSLVGCAPIDCTGVEVTNSQLQFNIPPVVVERSSSNSLTFNYIFSSSSAGGSVRGDNLWELEWYLSSRQDDIGGAAQIIPLTAQQMSVNLPAGTMAAMQGVLLIADTRQYTCDQFEYVCVRLAKSPSASVNFTLSASSEESLRDCARVTCRGVQVTSLTPTYISPPELQSGQDNFVNFDLRVGSSALGASVSGMDLWTVEIFANTDQSGNGITRAQSIATIPAASLHRGLTAGSSLILQDIRGALDLSTLVCADVPYVCVRLSRNQLSDPVFTLEDTDGAGDIVQCMTFACNDPQPCDSNPCLNGGSCRFANGVTSCDCPDAFIGDLCENVNRCFASNSCQNQGTCIPFSQDYICRCTGGYSGVNCDIPPDPCLSSPCLNAATCARLGTTNAYRCICADFFEGDRCQLEDPCRDTPCLNQGTCLGDVQSGTFLCVCTSANKGGMCQYPEPCFPSPCLNNGVCSSDVTGSQYTCTCQPGFTGRNCESLDPCFSSPCMNGGSCLSVNAQGSAFTCDCLPSYQGTLCQLQDPCFSSPCLNGAFCLPDLPNNEFDCICTGNFIGMFCQFPDPCFPLPCLNQGTCIGFPETGSFQCLCRQSFIGDVCQNIDPCLSSPCLNGGSCSSPPDGSSYSCTCTDIFIGTRCQDAVACASVPCANDGTCVSSQDGLTFTCNCPPEFLPPDCRARDPCFINPCQNDGVCVRVETPQRYLCNCRPQYLGVNCHIIDPCLSNPCLRGGTCTTVSQGLFYRCACPSDAFGPNCEFSDPCNSGPCANGGTCHPSGDLMSYTCICPSGFVGPMCQVMAPCTENPCRFGGTCVNDVTRPSGFVCLCEEGRTGDTCEGFDVCVILRPCSNLGTCVPNTAEGTFTCLCREGYTGETCQFGNPCENNPCLNGGTCVRSGGSYVCLCLSPYTGTDCEERPPTETPPLCQPGSQFACSSSECISINQRCDGLIDCSDGFSDEIGCPPPCNSLQFGCLDGSACIPLAQLCDNTPNCADGSDETVQQCSTPCASNPCLNGGSCTELTTTILSCTCTDGYTGFFCQIPDVTGNDPPVFTSPSMFIRSETWEVDSVVITLSASDPNMDTLEFGLLDGSQLFYMLDLSSGQIYLRSDLDREVLGDSVNITVTVRDSQGARTDQLITLIIEDVNDNAPTASNLPDRIQIPEDTPRSGIFQVVGTDSDDGINALLTYTIESVTFRPPSGMSTANLFAVNSVTGDVILTHDLDYETIQQYNITIVTQDLGSPSLSSSDVLTVDVLDVQDQGPVFVDTPYDRTIPETQMVGSVVQTVQAVDQDVTNPRSIVYNLISGNQDGYFAFDTLTGQLTLVSPLDRDSADVPSSFTFTVRASEDGFPANFITNTFTILVQDVQDEPPAFNQDNYQAAVSEDAGIGVVLPMNIFVTDQDRTTADVINIELQGPDSLPFSISPTSVTNEGSIQISVSSQLDYEETQSYQFLLVATETSQNTSLSYSVTSTVDVSVQDVNDNDPDFTQESFTGTVSEGVSVGTPVVSVDATDRDSGRNAEISYRIVAGNEEGLFRINTMTGEISTQSPSIDYETSQMRYTLTIEATNPTSPVAPAVGSSQVEAIIDILDVNDNSPLFDIGNYNTSVIEIADPGVSVIRVTATDADTGLGGEVRYRISSGNAGGVFVIDDVTGDITLRTALDREIRDFYSLTVVATDQAAPNNIGLTTVDIVVRDFNDNDPIWRQTSYDTEVSEGAENITFIIRVQADDADIGANARLTYSLSPDSGLFVIDPDTGEIFLDGTLDRETEDEITLNVIVTDNGNPDRPASTPATVTIRVTDTNDNPPVFVGLPYNYAIEENQLENTLVGQVFISDVDLVGEHTFSLNQTEGFRIDSSTGEIFTTGSFDRELGSFYQLLVSVSDGVATETITVNVTITNVNDNDPSFDQEEYLLFVPEDHPLLVGILTLNATDLDEDEGGITFRFESGRNVEGPFSLDPSSGLLEIISPLDHEQQSLYTLRVLAVDTLLDGVQRTGLTTVVVNVTDVNDNGPRFTQNPYPEETVQEDVGEGVAIAQVATTDEDLGHNSVVMYRIIQGNIDDIFAIDQNGVISRGPTPLDRETLDFYLLVVEAFDPSNPNLPSDSAVVTIAVTDVNDVVPEFTQSVYSRLDLTEDTEPGTRVIKVQAMDQDLDLGGEVQYQIVAGNEMGLFVIDSVTGEIRTMGEFPSISSTLTINLTVAAVDQSSPFNIGMAKVVINILDAGETPPVFVLPRYEVDSIENLGNGTSVVQVQALVENRQADLIYFLDPNAHPDVMEHFEVDEITGEITIRTPLDRESVDFFAFTVFAQGETVSSSTAVWVTVLDDNDNSPTFIEVPEDVTVAEGLPAQTVVGEIRTTDADINQNALVNYRISDGNREGAFTLRVGADAVRLITTRPLDREFTDEYIITIMAFDSGIPSLSTSEVVRITVSDTNDNPPFFTASSFTVEVTENELTSRPIAIVNVTDNDEAGTNSLRFTIDQDDLFEINDRGEITLVSALDREIRDLYQLTVRLEDPGYIDPQYQVFAPVDVRVLDENDNPPMFSRRSYQANVVEGQSSITVTTIEATDADLGPNSEIRFNVTGDNAEFFSIDPITGDLITEVELDREALDQYIVTVTATDQALDPTLRLTSTTMVTVDVTDTNDTPPSFLAEPYGPYSILEESPNAFIDTFQASDPDTGRGGTVTYSLVGQYREFFFINQFTGRLTVNPNRPLDYEEVQQINITIVAGDADGLQAMTDVTIDVVNINDNSPQFQGAPYTLAISENVANGTLAFITEATDADLGPPGVVTYSIIDGNDEDIFWINPETGEIYVNQTLDRETTASYNLVLEARDNPENTEDTRTTTTTLAITVSDADDVAPIFPNDRYFGNILENAAIGTLIDMERPIRAVDSDEVSVITYTISGNDATYFEIDALTGELQSLAVFDFEVRSLYVFTVRATDSQGSYAEATVLVTVDNSNDNEPLLDFDVYNFTIPENSETGFIVGQVNATDGDEDAFSFSITSGGDNLFVIDPDTGLITVAPRAVLDREVESSYTLTISVTDQGSPEMTTTGTVIIDLSDINDSPPVFEEVDFSVNVSESESLSLIGTFIANDPDLDPEIIYLIDTVTILDNNGRDISAEVNFTSWFVIDEISGNVSLVVDVDRELVSEIILVISATDENGTDADTRMSDPNAVVRILITDTNDNAPTIQPIGVDSLQEESSVGTIITTVTAQDPDQGAGGQVTFTIVDGEDLPIVIDPDTGVVTVNGTIDRELVTWVNFTIMVTDRGAPSLNSTVDVNLRITDINDNNPSFNQTTYTANVNESASSGECFMTVMAEDPDYADFGSVTYSLSGADGVFEIDTETGEICLIDGLDRESVDQYTLIVTARDNPDGSSNNRRETSTTVIVDITDTNEFAPRSEAEVRFNIFEGEPIGTVIGSIDAVDPDTPDEPLIYIITDIQPNDGEDLFEINETTGEIILINEIDADNDTISDEYRLDVLISDGGNPEQTTDVVTIIAILDINDTPPTFDPSYYNISVPEDYDTSNPVVTVSATDPDENTALTYMIVSGNEDEAFLISSDTGEIRSLRMFDHETQRLHQLTVSVTDQGGLSTTALVNIHITDILDHEPRFTETLYTFSVLENEPNGTEVDTILALDNSVEQADQGVVYSIIGGNEDDALDLDPFTGVITTTRPFDFEEGPNLLIITVQAEGGILTDTATVRVFVEDANDNAPIFEGVDFMGSIRETSGAGTFVHSVFARDADTGPNGVVKYRIVEGNIGGIFEIGRTNGLLTLTRSVSSLAELPTEFQLVVEAFDCGDPSQRANVTVIVSVAGQDNSGAPVFVYPEPGQVLELPENEEAGYLIVCLNATDVDGDVFYEFFTSGTANDNYKLFALNRTTGKLYANFSADREMESLYTFFVVATDEGSPAQITPLEITIAITDKDDNEAIFLTEGDERFGGVDENIGTSEVIGRIVPAVDADLNSTVYYCIVSGNDLGLFQIDGMTGEISTAGRLDFENQTTHDIIVKATNISNCSSLDLSGPFDPDTDRTLKRVVISLTNVDDTPNVFLLDKIFTGVSIDAGTGSSVITVQAIDPDTGLPADVTYRIKEAVYIVDGEDPSRAGNTFGIDPRSGQIFTQSLFTAIDLDGIFQLTIGASEDPTTLRDDACTVVEIQVFDADQRVVIIIDEVAPIVRSQQEILISRLSNITGGLVRIDEISEFIAADGSRQTRVVFHVINTETNQLLTTTEILNKIDESDESINTLLVQGAVVDSFPVGASGGIGGIGLIGALLLLLALLLLIAALLFIILLCCLPRWGRLGHKEEKETVIVAAAGAAPVGGEDSRDGTYTAYNTGSWSLDKEYEAQEQTMNFVSDNAYQVDQAKDVLLLTSLTGGGVANGGAQRGSHVEKQREGGYGGMGQGGSLRSSMRQQYDGSGSYSQVGVAHSDGSVSVQTDEADGFLGGTFPRVQETSFIETQRSGRRVQQQKGVTSHPVDRDSMRRDTAAEVRQLLDRQGRDGQQMSTSTAQFDDLNRSISVMVGYDEEETETTQRSRRSSRKNRRGVDNQAYASDSWEARGVEKVSASRQATAGVEAAERKRDEERRRLFEEKLHEYQEENIRLEEELRNQEIQMLEEVAPPRRQEIVEEIIIVDGNQPFVGNAGGIEYDGERLRDDISLTSSENSYSEEEYDVVPDSNYSTLRSDGRSAGSGFDGEMEVSSRESMRRMEKRSYQAADNGLGPVGFFERHSGL